MQLFRLFQPGQYERLAPYLSFIFLLLAIFFAVVGYGLVFAVPPEMVQGYTVYILYLHVPAAWASLLAYLVMMGAAILYLVYATPLARCCLLSVPVPAFIFCLMALITGSLWGRPTWGVWWANDARLVSFAVMTVFVGLLSLLSAQVRRNRRLLTTMSYLVLIGFINYILTIFSVDWYNNLHQGRSFIFSSANVSEVYSTPLVFTSLSFVFILAASICYLTRLEVKLLRG